MDDDNRAEDCNDRGKGMFYISKYAEEEEFARAKKKKWYSRLHSDGIA